MGDGLAQTLKSLIGDSVIYAIGAALLGAGNFILIPLLTRRLSPNDFGLYALIDITVLIVVSLTQMKLDVAYLRFFALPAETSRRYLLGTTLFAGGGAGLLGGVLLALVISIGKHQGLPSIGKDTALTLIPIVLFENLQGLLLSDLRARRKAAGYCSANVLRLFATTAATLWTLSFAHSGVYEVFLGRLIGDAVGTAVLLMLVARNLSFLPDMLLLRRMLAFGFPVIWSSMMVLLMDATGRLFLTRISGLEQVGYLAVAIKISGIFQVLITQPFGIAWGGFMFQIEKLPHAATIYSKILTYAILVSSAMGLVLVVLTKFLFVIFAPTGYDAAVALLPVAVLVRVLNLAEYPCAISIYLTGRTNWLAISYSAGLVLNVGLNYLLDERYGIRGVMWAWLGGWLAVVVLVFLAGQKFYPIRPQWWLLALAAVPWIALVFCPPYLQTLYRLNTEWKALISFAIVMITGVFIAHDLQRMRAAMVVRS